MQAERWETLWQGKEKEEWSVPDPDLVDLIPQLQKENIQRALDFGCGIGRHVILMAKAGFETYGIDAAPSGIEHCRQWLKAEKLQATLRVGDMHEIPYSEIFFDFVVAWNVIYHTTRDKMQAILQKIQRILRPGGLFYLTLNSTRNNHYGVGTEVAPSTFINPQKGDGYHLHHYSDETDVRDLLRDWKLESLKEQEESLKGKLFPESWHWFIVTRNTK